MNKFAQILFSFSVGILFSFALCHYDIWPFNTCNNIKLLPGVVDTFTVAPNEPEGGAPITPNEAVLAISNYQYAFLQGPAQQTIKGSQGGKIGLDVLTNLVQTCRNNNLSFVNFRYGYKNTAVVDDKRIYLILSAGLIPNPQNNLPLFRNSGDSYCPTQCSF